MTIVDVQLLRKDGIYWEANRSYIAMLKDMQYRGRMNGEQAPSYYIPSTAEIRKTIIIFILI